VDIVFESPVCRVCAWGYTCGHRDMHCYALFDLAAVQDRHIHEKAQAEMACALV
jgi:hypothetical protein